MGRQYGAGRIYIHFCRAAVQNAKRFAVKGTNGLCATGFSTEAWAHRHSRHTGNIPLRDVTTVEVGRDSKR